MKKKDLLKQFSERYTIMERDGGYLLYDKEGKARRANQLFKGTSVFITANDCKAKWYSEKTPTDIVATNTSGHSHIPVPRPHKKEWRNWRKLVSAANSQDTMAAASNFSATQLKRKPYLRKRGRRSLLHIKRGRQSRYRQHKGKSVVLILDNRPFLIDMQHENRYYLWKNLTNEGK